MTHPLAYFQEIHVINLPARADRRREMDAQLAAIGLGLTLIHLALIPITNASVNPARSTGTAMFAGGWALAQLWLFWIAPLIGGAAGGVLYRWLSSQPDADVVGDRPAKVA